MPPPNMPPQGFQPMPKQVLYPNVQMEVEQRPDGATQLVINAGFEILVFPMAPDYAQQLGTKLRGSNLHVAHDMPRRNGAG